MTAKQVLCFNNNSFLGEDLVCFCLFVYLILYVQSTIFQLNRDGSSCVEPVLT